MKKMKVVWLCYFVNELHDSLPLVKGSNHSAPWISLLIEEIKKINNVELHVISPVRWLKKNTELKVDGVYYYFYKTGMPFIHRHWPAIFKFDYWTDFYIERRGVKKIIKRINPDIINLHGVENPFYASPIKDLSQYPILITIQGLYTFSNIDSNNFVDRYRRKLEVDLLKQYDNFGVRVQFLKNHISNLNPQAQFYWFKYPFRKGNEFTSFSRENFDIIFFASVVKSKGIEDLIKAIGILFNRGLEITLKVVGEVKASYYDFLKELIDKNKISSLIEFVGFFPTQDELHNFVSQARISVLPTYNDILPGTIVESMFLKIPVIAYKANGVVDFNNDGENIVLVDVGNIEQLADKIELLIRNPNLRNEISERAFSFVENNFNNSIEAKKMIDSYLKVISKSGNCNE